ncbi:MAG TPA: peptide deformylase [Candidatus Dormibacteraeota bacterium]|nr:peptide deformylase [Candidatus Dormibacteraeota bacterium]
MVRPVRRFPDPVLKHVCRPATCDEARRVAVDLVDTMRAHPRCVGLAAPQIGETVRVAVVDVSGHPLATAHNGLVILVNATVVEAVGREVGREGCLSLPAVTADVRRARRIRVAGDALDGGHLEIWAAGFEARAIQHELDHLDGILILDRVTSVRALHPRVLPARQRVP